MKPMLETINEAKPETLKEALCKGVSGEVRQVRVC